MFNNVIEINGKLDNTFTDGFTHIETINHGLSQCQEKKIGRLSFLLIAGTFDKDIIANTAYQICSESVLTNGLGSYISNWETSIEYNTLTPCKIWLNDSNLWISFSQNIPKGTNAYIRFIGF